MGRKVGSWSFEGYYLMLTNFLKRNINLDVFEDKNINDTLEILFFLHRLQSQAHWFWIWRRHGWVNIEQNCQVKTSLFLLNCHFQVKIFPWNSIFPDNLHSAKHSSFFKYFLLCLMFSGFSVLKITESL